jgi:hypothetical protein
MGEAVKIRRELLVCGPSRESTIKSLKMTAFDSKKIAIS